MRDEHETSKLDKPVAAVTVLADVELLPAVVDFVRRTANQLGLRDKAAEHLDQAVGTVCRNVIDHAFESDEEGRYDVYVLRRPGQVVIAIEDRGLPFDYAPLQDASDTALPDMLHRSFADEVRFVNLGPCGNRVELIKHLPHADVREHLSENEHHRTTRAPAAPEDTPLEVRMMRPEESFELSRCVYRSYGYSYDWNDIYYPDRIRELQKSGLMHSCVALTPEGEFVGHLALTLERPDLPVGEAGQAVVDPRFRGHRLFERMKTFLAERAKEWGMYGLYSEATAVHPYSQKGNLHLGAKETGYLLGYIPASVSYKGIDEDRKERRESVALFYMRVNAEPEREAYPPVVYQESVRRVIKHNGLRRIIQNISEPEMPSSSRVSVNVRRDHNLAFLRVEEPGADLGELVRLRLRELCLHRVDCIYVDLPLCNPATVQAGAGLRDLGFFFGGIIPEAHGGAASGDVLRLQYLNNVEIKPDDLHTASDFGRELLETVCQQYKETKG
ncbi:MAG: ATP-binding protein [Actinomycetota bacterium]|jgi:serine/threonine-protein kinase RsbW|nr:ATP-binding protein [Actinomycetota bacterium]